MTAALIEAFHRRVDEARATLGVSPSDDAAAVRRAYRRAVGDHPPDRDAEGFQRVRAAYERLGGLLAEADAILDAKQPHIAAPAFEVADEEPDHALVVHLVQTIITRLRLEDILDAEQLTEPGAPKST